MILGSVLFRKAHKRSGWQLVTQDADDWEKRVPDAVGGASLSQYPRPFF